MGRMGSDLPVMGGKDRLAGPGRTTLARGLQAPLYSASPPAGGVGRIAPSIPAPLPWPRSSFLRPVLPVAWPGYDYKETVELVEALWEHPVQPFVFQR